MSIILADIPRINLLWHAVPLILVVSLVYGATRHESMFEILHNAYRAAAWIVSFIAIIFGVLLVISWLL
ncbi:MAG: hypothetical protein ACC628_13315 [Pirellulaceae bacterium]